MPRFKPKGVLERNASGDLWKNTLSRIPTVYGRLAYLASLRDQNSGMYRHHGLSTLFGREESSKALRESHASIFQEWLNLSLAEKHSELIGYLESLEESWAVVLDHWTRAGSYKQLLPDGARKPEIELFSREMEALVEVLKAGLREAASNQGSSLHG
ncbi:MAG TPA: hypothetical protein VKX39_11580 [Bryobacteraceae bacterium]|jgi:hypothetical protein|nr:hypothetical protein [Bryobacteraceae bacterium]